MNKIKCKQNNMYFIFRMVWFYNRLLLFIIKSFHELAVYDLTAAIDLVLSVTGYKKVDVGGVSLGGSIPLMALAERPEYNEKVRNLILMAPATRMGSAFKGVQHFLFRNIVRQILVIFKIFHFSTKMHEKCTK